MPRSGGIFSLIPGYFAVDGTTIEVSQHNPVFEDVAQALTDSLPRDGSAPMVGNLPMGGFKLTGLAAGTGPNDSLRFSQLGAFQSSVSALSLAADEMVYANGVNTAGKTGLTAFARTLLDDVDAATARTTLGVQAQGATLTSLEGLSLVAGDVLYATGADTLARLPKGTAGQALVMNAGATAPEWAETGGWAHIGAFSTITSGGIDVTDLGGYRDIMVVGVELVASLSGIRSLRVSSDNGATFLSTNIYLTATNGFTNLLKGHSSSGLTRSSRWVIHGFGTLDAAKAVDTSENDNAQAVAVVSGTAFNALRVFNDAGNITGGTVYVWGRP